MQRRLVPWQVAYVLPAIHRVCFILRTRLRVVIVRVYRDGRLLASEQANQGLVDTDAVEVVSVLGETNGRLRIACVTSIVKATELGNAEGWIEGKLADGVLREKPRPGVPSR
jgi:hypothetical protein